MPPWFYFLVHLAFLPLLQGQFLVSFFLFLSSQHSSTLSTSHPMMTVVVAFTSTYETFIPHGRDWRKNCVACMLFPSQPPFSFSCWQHRGHFFTAMSNNCHEHSVGFKVKALERVWMSQFLWAPGISHTCSNVLLMPHNSQAVLSVLFPVSHCLISHCSCPGFPCRHLFSLMRCNLSP